MHVFEIYFNPRTPQKKSEPTRQKKQEEDKNFGSFVYEPENIYEKKLGGLYAVGEIYNILPQNLKLLDGLAKIVKERYYNPALKNPEQALSEGLKSANEFLSREVKKDNVSWLGNLNFAVLGVKDFEVNITRVGDIKIFLLEPDQLIDIGGRLELGEMEPYPLKIFSNIISGKLSQDNIIFISTNDVFEFLKNKGILDKISKMAHLTKPALKEVLELNEKELAKISGVCLMLVLSPSQQAKERLILAKNLKKFSFAEFFSPLSFVVRLWRTKEDFLKPFKKVKKFALSAKSFSLKKLIKKRSFSKLFFSKKRNKTKKQKINQLPEFLSLLISKRNLILVLTLIVLTFSGFLFFNKINIKPNENKPAIPLSEIQEKVYQADSFLILKEEEKARNLLMEAWAEISSQNGKKAVLLKETIEQKLGELNKITNVQEPEVMFDFSQTGNFSPQKIAITEDSLLFINPESQEVYKLRLRDKNLSQISLGSKPELIAGWQSNVFIFSKPDIVAFITNDGQKTLNIQLPSSFNFSHFSAVEKNLYFLDSGPAKIVKYANLKPTLKLWLKTEKLRQSKPKSMAVDTSVWILNQDNTVDRYYRGDFKETLTLNIFPFPKSISKIALAPASTYLYFLEPVQKRIIITDKKGQIIKQFQGDKFDNLLDFAVSSDGKTIYLLDDLKIYQILDK